MRFRLLGYVEVECDLGHVHPLARRQERCLLAILLLEQGLIVPVDRLCALLWDDDPPETARRTVQAHAARIRAMLAGVNAHAAAPATRSDTRSGAGSDTRSGAGSDTRSGAGSDTRSGARAGPPELLSRGEGYQLRVDPDSVDVFQFRALLARAGATSPARERDRLLSQALALWQGPALHDAATSDLARGRLCADLDEQHLQAHEAAIAAGLELDRHRQLLPDLARLTAEHPTRERLVELYMQALHRDGRTAGALEIYQRARTRLAEELGIDPGPALSRLHLSLLRGQPPVAVQAPSPATHRSPAQLPLAVTHFTGRHAEIAELNRLSGHTGAAAVTIVAICGLAGVGKSALALHWAHTARDRFPDGQLYIDLRGHARQPPMRPIDALGVLLRGVGIEPAGVPVDALEAAALFRTTVSGRQMLIMLDNAHDAQQVRAILPGGAGCMVVVTSRNALSGLVARDGARRLSLDVLAPAESIELLRRTVGPDRVVAEPDATEALAGLCGHLPLALRIVAANLGDRPRRSISAQVDELRTAPGLGALEVDGDADTSARVAFALSYHDLAPAARRMFRLLALAPGPDLDLAGGAALAGVQAHQAERLMHQLVTAHLAYRLEPARYLMHDLIRRYAEELVDADETHAEREAARQRLFEHYLHALEEVVGVLCPQVVRMPIPPSIAARPSFTNRADARHWLDVERPNLVAAVQVAGKEGPAPMAWLIADRLRGYFYMSRHMPDWLSTAQAALDAATAHGDDQAQAAAHLSFGIAHRSLGQHRRSIDYLNDALDRCRTAGWAEGEASVLGSLGVAHAELGENRPALDNFTAALRLNRDIGRRGGEAVILTNLGNLRWELGDLRGAADDLGMALALYQEAREPAAEAIALANRSVVHLHLGQLDAAEADLARARALNEEIGNRYGEAFALFRLANVRCVAGRPAEAERYAQQALELARVIGDARAEVAALVALGDAALGLGVTPAAIERYQEVLRLTGDHHGRHAGCEVRARLAEAYRRAGDPDRALAEAGVALRLARNGGYAVPEGDALTVIAAVHLARGASTEASRYARQAVAVHRRTGYRRAEAAAAALLDDALATGASASS